MKELIERLGLLIHWAGFICLFYLIIRYIPGIFEGRIVTMAIQTTEFWFNSEATGNPVWWIWWVTLTHWPIKWFITGNKSFFPWKS